MRSHAGCPPGHYVVDHGHLTATYRRAYEGKRNQMVRPCHNGDRGEGRGFSGCRCRRCARHGSRRPSRDIRRWTSGSQPRRTFCSSSCGRRRGWRCCACCGNGWNCRWKRHCRHAHSWGVGRSNRHRLTAYTGSQTQHGMGNRDRQCQSRRYDSSTSRHVPRLQAVTRRVLRRSPCGPRHVPRHRIRPRIPQSR